MTEYKVKVGFWLRAYDGFSVEAGSDTEAIEKSKELATAAMQSLAYPEHIEMSERREGVILYVDRVTADGSEPVIECLEFDDDRIHPPPTV